MQLFRLPSFMSPPSSGPWKVLMGQACKGTHHFYSRTRSQGHTKLMEAEECSLGVGLGKKRRAQRLLSTNSL